MIRRLIYLGVVLALLVLGDIAARGFVESTVNARAQQEKPPESRVSASVGGFPFLPPLIFGTEVRHVSVHIENLETQVLTFAEVDIDLHGVRLDRGRLLSDRKARIKEIDRGKVTAIVTEQALSEALPSKPDVRMSGGQVTVAGVSATPRTQGGKLMIGGLTIPRTDYVPCVSAVEVQEGRMVLACEIEDIPGPLLDAVQEAVDN